MDGCFEDVETRLELNLHPSMLRDVGAAVREALDALLLAYRPELGGVPFAYARAEILSRSAPIHTFFPYVQVRASAVLTMLRLRSAQFLVGKVSRVGVDYIALLVLGVLTAAIHRDALAPRFRHDRQRQCWTDSGDAEHSLAENTVVRFCLQRVDAQDSHFILRGSVLEEGTGDLQRLRHGKSVWSQASGDACCACAGRLCDLDVAAASPSAGAAPQQPARGPAEVAAQSAHKKKKRKSKRGSVGRDTAPSETVRLQSPPLAIEPDDDSQAAREPAAGPAAALPPGSNAPFAAPSVNGTAAPLASGVAEDPRSSKKRIRRHTEPAVMKGTAAEAFEASVRNDHTGPWHAEHAGGAGGNVAGVGRVENVESIGGLEQGSIDLPQQQSSARAKEKRKKRKKHRESV